MTKKKNIAAFLSAAILAAAFVPPSALAAPGASPNAHRMQAHPPAAGTASEYSAASAYPSPADSPAPPDSPYPAAPELPYPDSRPAPTGQPPSSSGWLYDNPFFNQQPAPEPRFAISAPVAKHEAELSAAYDLLGKARSLNIGQTSREPGNAEFSLATKMLKEIIAADPECVEALAMLSYTYRLRGGGYAKDYFQKACAKLDPETAKLDPDDLWEAQLALAALYVAGEARFWSEAADYQTKGQIIAAGAARHIAGIKANLSSGADEAAYSRLLRAEAVAKIILGDYAAARTLLVEAVSLPSPEREKAEKYLELFDKAASGEWLWPVSQDAAIYDFLLYFCYDPSRRVTARAN